mgnify:CR=1 FL=1
MDEQTATTSPYRPTILLVDDEESILNSLRRLLRGQPFDVVLAGSGAEALEVMAAQPIDLVMSDARMPGMDGAQLLQLCAVSASGQHQNGVDFSATGKIWRSRSRRKIEDMRDSALW